MYISMNGPLSPGFPLPTWVLVNEGVLWEHGIPDAIPNLDNPTVCQGNPCLAVFASREEALAFVAKSGMTDVRPLVITGLVVFIAILSNRISNGIEYVVRYCPDQPGSGLWECNANELLKRLSDAAKSDRG